jgi:hypothetical protein
MALSLVNDDKAHCFVDEKLKYYSTETLKSTERILQYCMISENNAHKTLVCMENQKDKFNIVGHGLDETDNELVEIENNLNELKKNFCCFTVSLTGLKRFCKHFQRPHNEKCKPCRQNKRMHSFTMNVINNNDNSRKLKTKSPCKTSDCSSSSIHILLGNEITEENQIARNIAKLTNSLCTLKSMATNIADELSVQNNQIELFDNKITSAACNLRRIDQTGKSLLKTSNL